jgi:hypothetical protein
LVLVAFTDQTASASTYVNFNADTATNYSLTSITGDGTTASSGRATSTSAPAVINTSESITIMNVMNYSNTTTFKTTISRRNSVGGNSAGVRVVLWRSTAAITSLSLIVPGSTFTANSTFNLYGILGANA